MMDIGARFKASDDPGRIAAALGRDGAVIVESLLGEDLLGRLNADLQPLIEAATPDHDGRFVNTALAAFFGRRTRHVTGIAGKSPVFASEVLPHPLYLSLCDAVLRPNCSAFQLNLAHVMDRGPGSEQQFIHRDHDIWAHLPHPHPEVQLSSVLALVDFTADNGATRVVPGSHTWPRQRRPDADEIVAAEMPAGSAVIYLGSTLHAGGANVTSDQWRRGMHLSYCAGWLRTEENQFLATPLDVVRGLPRRSAELLGFAAHDAIEIGGGYLGTVELQHPLELLERGEL